MSTEVNKDIEVYYIETSDSFNLKNHFHNSHEIIYIEEGQATFNINNEIYRCEKGDVIFISNLESHHVQVTSYPYKRFFLLIQPQYFDSIMKDPLLTSILKHRPGHFVHVVKLSENHREIMRKIFLEIYNEQVETAEYSQHKMGCYLQIFLIELFRNYRYAFPLSQINKSMNTILEVQKYIEENYKDDISLENIAKLFYINMYYLSHQFKEITGFSFKEYLILQRISRAKHLLFHTDFDITAVSLEAGFNNVNHFIRIFKKFEGDTPYQYRKNLRAT